MRPAIRSLVRLGNQWNIPLRALTLRRPPLAAPIAIGMCAVVMMVSACAGDAARPSDRSVQARRSTTASARTKVARPQGRLAPFDPAVGAPLPQYRIVAAYGIVGGGAENGPASSLQSLDAFLPQLQALGAQYAALDPTHPVRLAIDLVVNVIQPCSQYPKWCASFADDATIQAYVNYCQRHHLLLFFDLQLGVEPVADAVVGSLQPYLQRYPFTELALDTEFHFPNTPSGYAEAAGYPCCLGWMDASEINWAIGYLAQTSLTYHLPRKTLVIHQWNSAVIQNKAQITLNPNTSVVLQSDGWGPPQDKLGDYQAFVQQSLIEYGGYKLFLPHPGDTQYDSPLQSPQDVLRLFPQPLFVSYQ